MSILVELGCLSDLRYYVLVTLAVLLASTYPYCSYTLFPTIEWQTRRINMYPGVVELESKFLMKIYLIH